ncbi:DUF5709 domain-containing protein [Actinotalea sp. K2]|uniref:DUF5709 domain-containing protein n=1 Tax=Actinotalea sp. K2 TaxID=2939438 RepID=UPI0020183306|nr:DUF5709 domain-containing protein [Actinotalea sp. K2]MCL3859995.1 DUF5709 domain-containing protein [Actinotalea sp. K2]
MTSDSQSYGDTPATTPDPESVAEGDTNQLEQEDTLLDRGVDSVLDEGYSPPEHRPGHRLETQLEQYQGEALDDRLAQEQPEVWETTPGPDAGAREADRAGRLAAAESEAGGETATSLMAQDMGIAGGGAGAEEAAVHLIDEDEDPERL